ncbi:aldo/keto reductase [Entomobacter blattae]|uniref:aldo/keto reductase n=1 Tax=Entomobacter blattae TaxID=2762277 RepID=UPI001EF0228C|nr:aldo/keto reductase [Entomobacter blattae]
MGDIKKEALPDATKAGTYRLRTDSRVREELDIVRLGFGAMRITGKGIWGYPPDIEQAKATLRKTQELGINFIDTADSYGPFVSEELIRETLYPYPKGLIIATKGGHTRHGPNIWRPIGNTDYLRQCVLMSLRRLKVERIDLWQLHRVGIDVPPEAQFQLMGDLQAEGLILYGGLSEVSVEMIKRASQYFTVATVQNRYNLVNRHSEDVLQYCEDNGIGFIPWAPLAAGSLEGENGRESVLVEMARRKKVTPGQLSLAWLLRRSPAIIPIPGTSNPQHLESNTRAAEIELTDEEFVQIDEYGRNEWHKTKTTKIVKPIKHSY